MGCVGVQTPELTRPVRIRAWAGAAFGRGGCGSIHRSGPGGLDEGLAVVVLSSVYLWQLQRCSIDGTCADPFKEPPRVRRDVSD